MPEHDFLVAGAHIKVIVAVVVHAASDVGILPVNANHHLVVLVVHALAVHIAEVIFTPLFAGAVRYPELFLLVCPLLGLLFCLQLALLFCVQLALLFPIFFMSCRRPSRRRPRTELLLLRAALFPLRHCATDGYSSSMSRRGSSSLQRVLSSFQACVCEALR